jgi:hypothetical protein
MEANSKPTPDISPLSQFANERMSRKQAASAPSVQGPSPTAQARTACVRSDAETSHRPLGARKAVLLLFFFYMPLGTSAFATALPCRAAGDRDASVRSVAEFHVLGKLSSQQKWLALYMKRFQLEPADPTTSFFIKKALL